MGEDFLCSYEPQGAAVIEPLADPGTEVAWTPEAEARLEHVPAFVRRFVRRRAEDYARELNADAVTADHLQALARRRFGAAGPPGMAGTGPLPRPERPGGKGNP